MENENNFKITTGVGQGRKIRIPKILRKHLNLTVHSKIKMSLLKEGLLITPIIEQKNKNIKKNKNYITLIRKIDSVYQVIVPKTFLEYLNLDIHHKIDIFLIENSLLIKKHKID